MVKIITKKNGGGLRDFLRRLGTSKKKNITRNNNSPESLKIRNDNFKKKLTKNNITRNNKKNPPEILEIIDDNFYKNTKNDVDNLEKEKKKIFDIRIDISKIYMCKQFVEKHKHLNIFNNTACNIYKNVGHNDNNLSKIIIKKKKYIVYYVEKDILSYMETETYKSICSNSNSVNVKTSNNSCINDTRYAKYTYEYCKNALEYSDIFNKVDNKIRKNNFNIITDILLPLMNKKYEELSKSSTEIKNSLDNIIHCYEQNFTDVIHKIVFYKYILVFTYHQLKFALEKVANVECDKYGQSICSSIKDMIHLTSLLDIKKQKILIYVMFYTLQDILRTYYSTISDYYVNATINDISKKLNESNLNTIDIIFDNDPKYNNEYLKIPDEYVRKFISSTLFYIIGLIGEDIYNIDDKYTNWLYDSNPDGDNSIITKYVDQNKPIKNMLGSISTLLKESEKLLCKKEENNTNTKISYAKPKIKAITYNPKNTI